MADKNFRTTALTVFEVGVTKDFQDFWSTIVHIFLKILGNRTKFDGKIGSYYPDFYIKLNNQDRWIVETKGAESLNDPRKFERLKDWCLDASKTQNISWDCLYLRQEIWNAFNVKPVSFEQLVEFLSFHSNNKLKKI